MRNPWEIRSQVEVLESFIARQPEIPEAAEAIVKRVITFLEDRRILYAPDIMENAAFCVVSVERMRRFLTEEIYPLSLPDDLKNHLREMRRACRKFMQEVVIPPGESGPSTLVLIGALKELRAAVLPRIAMLAAQYHITDIDRDLASTLPTHHENESG